MTDSISSTVFNEVKIFQPTIFKDERGEFFETYSSNCNELVALDGSPLFFREDDISISCHNVLRGLHGDTNTWKLIQCLHGEVFFALVDVNPKSKTYLLHETFTLNDTNRKQILVPPYFVNGYLCRTPSCIFAYKQTNFYSGAANQISLRWNDPKLQINWPSENPILSERDSLTKFL
jgi:dTDP-4-dehydrorhamnose 3,5-epimerase